jgi:integrase
MSDYSYQWIESDKTYCVFDEMEEPIIEVYDYLKAMSTTRNDQQNHAVALKHWFEFLDSALKGLHFSRAETSHIQDFIDWLKTPPHLRDMYKRLLQVEEHTIASTRNQYIEKVALFYERYVMPRFPECDIAFKKENPHKNAKGKQQRIMTHRERQEEAQPDTRSIPPRVFKEIKAGATESEKTAFRNAVLLDLIYIAGLRRGEAVNIDIRQFEYVDRSKPRFKMTIHFSSHERLDNQTKTGGREIYIPSKLAERIGSYIEHYRVRPLEEHYTLFTANEDVEVNGCKAGDPLSGRAISAIFKNATIKAGYLNYSIHDCRHSMVTNANSMGVPLKEVMEQAGHKDPNTTMKYRSRHVESKSLDDYSLAVYDLIQ